jgi:hypothetical protein
VKFLKNLAAEIISFFQIGSTTLEEVRVPFRAANTSTNAHKIIFSRRPENSTPHSFLIERNPPFFKCFQETIYKIKIEDLKNKI